MDCEPRAQFRPQLIEQIQAGISDRFVTFLSWQYAGSAAAYALILVISLVNSVVGLALGVILTMAYVMPPRAPEYLEEPKD